ncbi:MAG: hypothetical protein JXR97_00670, partial [Planctomycetes bacterium]|nr:hypothetical protein [Planctomycetota bacterium]
MMMNANTYSRLAARVVFAVLLAITCAAPFCGAAEFDINGPTVELRRIQFCTKCGKPLVVTTVPSGARIVCPHCDTVQFRIPNKNLLLKVYQVCPNCGSRMDVNKYEPGEVIKCGNCGLGQKVLEDAIVTKGFSGGTGRMPDAPV